MLTKHVVSTFKHHQAMRYTFPDECGRQIETILRRNPPVGSSMQNQKRCFFCEAICMMDSGTETKGIFFTTKTLLEHLGHFRAHAGCTL